MATAQLNLDAFKRAIKERLHGTSYKMLRIADEVNAQIHERFATAGASGGVNWPQGVFPALAKTPPLAGMEKSFVPHGEDGVATVTCEGRWAAVHQQGCISKGGVLPDIVPVKAKVLYLPLTPLGVLAHENYRQQAPVIESIFAGVAMMSKPKFSGNTFSSGEAKYGVDYIFASRVSIPARPMLPTSDHERAALAKQAMKILALP